MFDIIFVLFGGNVSYLQANFITLMAEQIVIKWMEKCRKTRTENIHRGREKTCCNDLLAVYGSCFVARTVLLSEVHYI